MYICNSFPGSTAYNRTADHPLKNDKELQINPAYVLSVVREAGHLLQFACSNLQSNMDIGRAALLNTDKALPYVANAEVVAEYLREHFFIGLQPLNPLLSSNSEFALRIIKDPLQKPKAIPILFSLLDEKLRSDRTIAWEAVIIQSASIQFAGDSIKNWAQIMTLVLRKNISNFKFVGQELRKNENYMRKAIQIKYEALQFADISLRSNRAYLLKLLEQHPEAFSFIDKKLQCDRAFIFEVMEINPNIYAQLEKSFQLDKDIVKLAFEKNGNLLEAAPAEIKKDRKLILKAMLTARGYIFDEVHADLKKDRLFVLKILEINGLALCAVDDSLLNDKELILTALRQDGHALQFVPDELAKDLDVLITAFKQDPKVLRKKLEDDDGVKIPLVEIYTLRVGMETHFEFAVQLCWIDPEQLKLFYNCPMQLKEIAQGLGIELHQIREDESFAVKQNNIHKVIDMMKIDSDLKQELNGWLTAPHSRKMKSARKCP